MSSSIKDQIYPDTIRVTDFNNPLSYLDRSSELKIRKENLWLNNSIDQVDLTVIYRIFYTRGREYILLPETCETFSPKLIPLYVTVHP